MAGDSCIDSEFFGGAGKLSVFKDLMFIIFVHVSCCEEYNKKAVYVALHRLDAEKISFL